MSETGRTCGDCSMCCKVMYVPELDKPDGVWCRHAKPGAGCGIYETRPQVCRGFMCLWVLEPRMSEALKPTRSKVVLSSSHSTGPDGRMTYMLLASCDASAPDAWRREPMYGFLKDQTRTPDGRPQAVVVRAGKRSWVMTPNGPVDLGIASGTQTFELAFDADGKPTAKLTTSTPGPGKPSA
jgi:hypothetical protein